MPGISRKVRGRKISKLCRRSEVGAASKTVWPKTVARVHAGGTVQYSNITKIIEYAVDVSQAAQLGYGTT
jgi:hypothetical protein